MATNATISVIKQAIPQTNTENLNVLLDTIKTHGKKYGVDNSKRIAMFLAQCAHESMNFNKMQENSSGSQYEGNKNLGNNQKGDGVRFKGRGFKQITGRWNYGYISKKMFGDLRFLTNPAILEQPLYGAISALIFWDFKKIAPIADTGNLTKVTKVINGGTNGLEDRRDKFIKISAAIANNPKFIDELTNKSLIIKSAMLAF